MEELKSPEDQQTNKKRNHLHREHLKNLREIESQEKIDFRGMIEKVIKLSGGIALYLLLAGFVNLFSFYIYYGIQIGHYINASEIIVSSFDTIFICIIFITIFLSFFRFSFYLMEKTTIPPFIIYILLTLVFFTVPLLFGDYPINRHYDSITNYVMCSVCGYLFGLLMYFLFHKPEISAYSKWHIVNGITGLFASIIILNGYRYSTITDSKMKIKNWVEISFSDSTKIKKGDTTNIFIGKTDNFYFIYNRKEKNTNIYPASNVDKVVE